MSQNPCILLEDLETSFVCRSVLFLASAVSDAQSTVNQVLRVLGPTIALWTPGTPHGFRLKSWPLRHAGRVWEHRAASPGPREVKVPLDAEWSLLVVIDAGLTDRWEVALKGSARTLKLLAGADHVWRSADGLAAIGAFGPPALAFGGEAVAEMGPAGPVLRPPPLHMSGGLGIPKGARLDLWFGDGAPNQFLSKLEPSVSVPPVIADMVAPRLAARSDDLVLDGAPLVSPTVGVQIRTTFTRLATPVGPIEADAPIVELGLDGPSLCPPDLKVLLGHSLGGALRSSVEVLARRVQGDATSWTVRLDPPFQLRPDQPRLGEIVVRIGGERLGAVELRPAPLPAYWIHPAPAGHAAKMPQLTTTAACLELATATGVTWDIEPNGQVRYGGGQVGELLDHAFEPLLPAPGGRAGLEVLVREAGPLQAWLPDDLATNLERRDPIPELLLTELAAAGKAGQRLRLGAPGTARRGVLDPKVFDPIRGKEVPCTDGLFRLGLPAAPRVATIWHRGLLLRAELKALSGPDGPPQAALWLTEPLSIDARRDPELGPFLPLRAWHTGSNVRLSTGRVHATLQRRGGPFPWQGDEPLGLYWHGHGYYSTMEPPESDPTFAWRGLILEELGASLGLRGWLVTGDPCLHQGPGAFEDWGLVLGAPQADTSGGLIHGHADLGTLPADVAAVALELLEGKLARPEVRVRNSDGTWVLKPRGTSPLRPPEGVEVQPPSATAPVASARSVRIWLE